MSEQAQSELLARLDTAGVQAVYRAYLAIPAEHRTVQDRRIIDRASHELAERNRPLRGEAREITRTALSVVA